VGYFLAPHDWARHLLDARALGHLRRRVVGRSDQRSALRAGRAPDGPTKEKTAEIKELDACVMPSSGYPEPSFQELGAFVTLRNLRVRVFMGGLGPG